MSSRWTEVTESAYAWEQEALRYIREHLPDQEPFRAWSNFEFIADDGSINEVDLLVLSLYKIFLVEIKSRPGRVSGDAGVWTWETNGRLFTDDNPLLLTNRKAKKLKSLLGRQAAFSKQRVPYIQPLVFLSALGLRCDLQGTACQGVYLRRENTPKNEPDIISVLTGEQGAASLWDDGRSPRLDRRQVQALGRAMERAGIHSSNRARRVGDYQLERLIHETDVYQDWEAAHVSLAKTQRRVRLYPYALSGAELNRKDLRRAAEREYRILEGISHPGILRAEGFTEHERGPAVIFEHDSSAERLDLFLRDRADQLDLGARLDLVRQLAETLQHAHERRLYHRALSPQTILVSEPGSSRRQLKLFDWQTAQRDASTGASIRSTSDDTLQLGLFGDQQSLLYMAPEAIAGLPLDALKLDVFSLGAVAYHIFSGVPPATSIEELQRKCDAGPGLRLSEAMDGASDMMQLLIQSCTDPSVEGRPHTLREVLSCLDNIEEELTVPASEATVHPLDASINDQLEGGFVVKQRLGKGSTCVALLVQRDDREGVLKVALRPELNERIQAEGRVLQQARHSNIAELYEQGTVSGHAALFMAVAGADLKSGEYTLAQRLRAEGRISLDFLQRFGEELLVVTQWMEQQTIVHRDIKPDNIGVGKTPSGALTLILFDFSLANAPVDNIRAGTPPYLDPFLWRRQPARWDLYAERFAVAMTLYEMATGALPIWGDGQSDPSMLDCEVSLDVNAFDPALREDLTAFFAKALHSDYRQRFDHAEEILQDWRRIFLAVDRPLTETDHDTGLDWEHIEAQLQDHPEPETPLAALALSPKLLDALSRIGAQTVGELLGVKRIRLYRTKGLGQQTIRDLRKLAELAERVGVARADAISTAPTPEEDDAPAEPHLLSVERMAQLAVSKRLKDDNRQLLLAVLGLDESNAMDAWLPLHEEAEALEVSRQALQRVLQQARNRWASATYA